MGNETVQICKEEELDADGRTYKLETWEMGRCVVLTRGDGFRIYTGHMYEKGGAYDTDHSTNHYTSHTEDYSTYSELIARIRGHYHYVYSTEYPGRKIARDLGC